jgi:hypothetical protein
LIGDDPEDAAESALAHRSNGIFVSGISHVVCRDWSATGSVVVAISAAGREPVGEPGLSTLIIRRLGRDEASAETASMTTTDAASGRHSRLNQADSRQCEQGYKHFLHHASSFGTILFPKN